MTPSVAAAALPESREPLFVAAFHTNINAQLSRGAFAKGTAVGAAKISGETLDLRRGGHVTFAHRNDFDLRPRLSIECWVRFEEAGDIPVVLSCGQYSSGGWFLQRFGKHWRWHVGGINCDGGDPAMGKWTHLLATFDGRRARLFENGVEVASERGEATAALWSGPLFVGQYGAEPGPKFQVHGQIAGAKIYRRAVPADEALVASRKAPGGEP